MLLQTTACYMHEVYVATVQRPAWSAERYSSQLQQSQQLGNNSTQLSPSSSSGAGHSVGHDLSWIPLCRYDTTEGGDLYNALVDNPRVEATSTGFRYLSQFGIRDKASLLEHIRTCPTGVRSIDFKDSYMCVCQGPLVLWV
jgi:hypothetical protein